MRNTHKNIETLSNIAIIIVAFFIGISLISRYFNNPAKQSVSDRSEIKAGTKLPLSDVNWSKSSRTLVMVLSTSCHFCAESTAFYQEIARLRALRDDVRLIAVMPQGVDDAKSYFKERSISVDEVRQASLSDIHVKGTPTLIVVDQSGSIIESWVGKLPLEKEAEVITHFFGQSSSS